MNAFALTRNSVNVLDRENAQNNACIHGFTIYMRDVSTVFFASPRKPCAACTSVAIHAAVVGTTTQNHEDAEEAKMAAVKKRAAKKAPAKKRT
ncbi:MAG: hypothetical protein F2567_08040, partial [Actinobacteria bacterium]|nr:hypothetical protein [Actinomycetota bacterium]